MGLKPEQFENTNENFSDVTFDVTDGSQTIIPISATVTIVGASDVSDYDGEEHSVVGYSASTENPLYDVDSDFTFSGTAEAKRTNVVEGTDNDGTTEMGLDASQFENVNPNFRDVVFEVTDGYQTIEPIEATVIIVGHNATYDYDGEEHEVTGYDVTIEEGSLYTEDDFNATGSALARGTNAGTVNMNLSPARFSNKNKNFSNVTFEVTDGYLTIEPISAKVTIKGHTGTFAYDGEEHVVSGYDVSIDNDLYKESDIRVYSTAEVKRTQAGTTEMGIHETTFSNKNHNFVNVEFEVEDGWITVNPVVVVSKTLNNLLATRPETFKYDVKLTDDDDKPIADHMLADGVVTDANGVAHFTLDASYRLDASRSFCIPLESSFEVTEDKTDDVNNYRTTVKVGDDESDTNTWQLLTVTDSSTTIAFTNAKTPICKVGNEEFQTIASAVDYIAGLADKTGTIEMLVDYVMPPSDVVTIPSGLDVTIATAGEYDGDGSVATITRSSSFDDGPLFTNNGTLSFGSGEETGGVILDGASIEATGALVSNAGTLNVYKHATLQNAHNTGDGGAVYSSGGSVNVVGGAIVDNTAGKGGAVFAAGGSVVVSDGEISGNEATNTGSGHGGAIYVADGTASISGGTLSANKTTTGNGGAVYVAQGSVDVTGGSISSNEAKDGAAIFIAAGSGTFTGGEVTGNAASSAEGGAVGIGGTSVTLNFSEKPVIIDNVVGGEQRNVCLSADSALVINSNGLSSGASVGIFVPGDGTLYHNRGVSQARFGRYTTTDGANCFSNDRTPGMTVSTSNSWLVWGKPITIESRYRQTFTPSNLPPSDEGEEARKKVYENVYPSSIENYVADLAADYPSGATAAGIAFACAFADGDTSYDQCISQVNWDNSAGTWGFVRRDGSVVTNVDKLILYFSYPSYISVANNTDHTMDISSLTLNTVNAASNGFGFVIARNGATVDHFVPISANDLQLAPNNSIKMMFPGVNNKAYVLNGKLQGVVGEETIEYTYDTAVNGTTRRTDSGSLDAAQATAGFRLTGNTFNVNNSTSTINIVFGDATNICKIVELNADGTVKEEHLYASLQEAVEDGAAHYSDYKVTEKDSDGNDYETVKIEMLRDYLIPGTDAPNVPSGKSFTFTTAVAGKTKGEHSFTPANPDEENPRAKISRDQGNAMSFIRATAGGPGTRVTIKDIIFDGKEVAVSQIDGGVLNTKNCRVDIDNISVISFTANNGGAFYVDYSNSNAFTDRKLTVNWRESLRSSIEIEYR